MSYRVMTSGVRIPVPGDKVIEEYAGRVASDEDRFSLARMTAPPGWGEPPQRPEFGELTIVVAGRFRVEVNGETVDLEAGHAIWVEPDIPVRYHNPFDDPAEYWAICLPAFTPERARREDG